MSQFGDLVTSISREAVGHEKQLQREQAQRESALGHRARSITNGDLGPVLKRWVTSSIQPVSGRLRAALEAFLSGDLEGGATLLSSPVFGLPEASQWDPKRPIAKVAQWALRDGHMDDYVLGTMGVFIKACALKGDEAQPLTRLLTQAGETCRETTIGQFLTSVQGAKAMMKVRKSGRASWQQTQTMNEVAALLGGQVRGALSGSYTGDAASGSTSGDGSARESLPVGGRAVVSVTLHSGATRRIELRVPEAGDWDVLALARQVRGERDVNLGVWSSFAMMVICAAQAEAGWFDLVKVPRRPDGIRANRGRHHKAPHGIVLSDMAHEAIKKDLDKWMGQGFTYDPMLVEPVNGDYLSVKHRMVAGGKGPRGMKTKAEGTTAAEVANDVIACTPWAVPGLTLDAIRDSELVQSLVVKSVPDELKRLTILGEYKKLASEDKFWLPTFMDFRGRVYPRTTSVTYQGGDLQKALMVFPKGPGPLAADLRSSVIRAVVFHSSNLYGNGLDKAGWGERREWFMTVASAFLHRNDIDGDSPVVDLLQAADEPLQLLTTLGLWARSPEYRGQIACQIDGTCNGLQHLSALFRDETAAPFVNLCASNMETPPSDLYGRVAARVLQRLSLLRDPWARRVAAAVKIDRKLCKKPVMVLPYGGTRTTIEDAVLGAMLEQPLDALYWTHGDPRHEPGSPPLYQDWIDGNYGAFRDRALKDHPLLHSDAKKLGGLVYECIEELLPKAMAAMEAFRKIARHVGDRQLAWSNGFGDKPMWIVQAKSKAKAARMALQGFQLPGSVRGLQIRQGSDEVDSLAHVTGLVANFIHSLDARHLVGTAHLYYKNGGRGMGAIHDCYLARPQNIGLMGEAAREAFEFQYTADPLSFPVRVGDEEFPSWYALADSLGVSFPENGLWEPKEVLGSFWCFS